MRLGRATYPLLFDFLSQELRADRSVVIDASFGPPIANREFAAIHQRWPFDALQLYCTAPREVLLSRYAARAPTRHPGHLDASIQDEVADALADGRWAPLSIPPHEAAAPQYRRGRCTERPLDPATLSDGPAYRPWR
jgi:predicted kinase